MRFIMVTDTNDLAPIEEDCQERARRWMVQNVAESNRVGDLCNGICKHAQAIRQERTGEMKIMAEEQYRRRIGTADYQQAKEKADTIRKAREIFHTNTFEDIKWRGKFCTAKYVSAVTRQMGISTSITPTNQGGHQHHHGQRFRNIILHRRRLG